MTSGFNLSNFMAEIDERFNLDEDQIQDQAAENRTRAPSWATRPATRTAARS